MTHCRSVAEKPSARWADGAAPSTMVASSTTISWATPITARISQRRLPGSVPGEAAAGEGADVAGAGARGPGGGGGWVVRVGGAAGVGALGGRGAAVVGVPA